MGIQIVPGHDGKLVGSLPQEPGDVQGEGKIAALVGAGGLLVYINRRNLIHRAKVQQHPILSESLREREETAVTQRLSLVPEGLGNAGKRRFRGKGHQNFAGIPRDIVPVCQGKVPETV